MRTYRLVLCAGVVALTMVLPPRLARVAAAEEGGAKLASFTPHPLEQEVIERVNQERARYGMGPVELDVNLMNNSRRHTAWMIHRRSFSHSGMPVAENIAMGQSSPAEAMHSWMNSSGHRANILNRGHRRIGVACYAAPNGTIYWCQQFSN